MFFANITRNLQGLNLHFLQTQNIDCQLVKHIHLK